MSGGGGTLPSGAVAAPPAPALSARGAPGLLDAGSARYVADLFDRELNPQLGRPDMNYLEPDLFQYSDTQGTRSFREEIAKFLTHYARAAKTLNPEHGRQIAVMNGCCAVFATLSTVLCDPSDGYLIPAPYCGGINSKTWLYGGTQPVHVPLFSEGIRVRALILINPHNPLGDIYPCDGLPDPERTHFMWGFSKDFGMSGIRVGALYTRNHEIWKAVNQLAVFCNSPGPVQHVLSRLLRGREAPFKQAQNILVDGLADVGIPVLKSSGGLCVWADFRKFLKSQTFEAELELWQKLLDKKLLISPGKAFYCYEPGWFRLVFSDSVDKIYLCIQILEQMLHSYAAEPVTNNTSSAADASCNPEKDSLGKLSNTPGKEISQLKMFGGRKLLL